MLMQKLSIQSVNLVPQVFERARGDHFKGGVMITVYY